MRVFVSGLLVGAMMLSAVPAHARSRPDGMIANWTRLNGLCRGGSGDDPRTTEACVARDTLTKQIDQAGWCYGREGQLGYQFEWHACGLDSNRPS